MVDNKDGIRHINRGDLWREGVPYPKNRSLGEENALAILIAAIDRMEGRTPTVDLIKGLS